MVVLSGENVDASGDTVVAVNRIIRFESSIRIGEGDVASWIATSPGVGGVRVGSTNMSSMGVTEAGAGTVVFGT